ncbi:helix-turn-helix transcriptional regulator [Leucobacter chromiiresistens]
MVIRWNELRDAREQLSLTQEELAAKLGVSTRTIVNWERVGVARKAEYKVERFFGDALKRDEANRVDAELDYISAVAGMSTAERAEHEDSISFEHVLKEASDAELLEELTRRARTRGLVAVSKEWELPRQSRRESTQILRGERSTLSPEDLSSKVTRVDFSSNVGGSNEDVATGEEAIPEDVENEWAGQYAASPKGNEPEDHTP